MRSILLPTFQLMIMVHKSDESYKPRVTRSAQPPIHPLCRQVPTEVCHQVPKTVYEPVASPKCIDVSQEVCANVEEQFCKILQLPVQGEVHRRDCSIQPEEDCKVLYDVKRECVIKDECFEYSELKCVDVPRILEETLHEEFCEVITTDDCVTNIKNKCDLKLETKCTNNTIAECEVTIEKKCSEEENRICEDAKCHYVTEKECKKVPFTECKVCLRMVFFSNFLNIKLVVYYVFHLSGQSGENWFDTNQTAALTMPMAGRFFWGVGGCG